MAARHAIRRPSLGPVAIRCRGARGRHESGATLRRMSRAVAATLLIVTAATLLLRTGSSTAATGSTRGSRSGSPRTTSRDIPRLLGQDGIPPLYYLLLHGWMAARRHRRGRHARAVADLRAARRAGRRAGPGRAVFDRRAGALAAAGAAGSPFLTYYAQETRMYSLVAAALDPRLGELRAGLRARASGGTSGCSGCGSSLLLYTHKWGLFLARGDGRRVAGAVAARRGRRPRRRAAGRGLALLYAPWLPSLVFQAAAHRGAVGGAAVAAVAARLPGRPLRLRRAAAAGDRGVLRRAAAAAGRSAPSACWPLIAVVAAVLAWLCSQIEPAWATRYLAVVLGPLLLALAAVRLARARAGRGWRWSAWRVVWLLSGPPPVKSNVRTVADRRSRRDPARATSWSPPSPSRCRRCIATCREGVRLPDAAGARRATRGQTDWRDGAGAAARGQAERVLLPPVDRLAPRPPRAARHARSPARARHRRRGPARCGSARASGARGCAPTPACARSARRPARPSRSGAPACGRSCSRSCADILSP